MKYYYYVLAQAAKADAPSFYTEGYKELLEKGKDHFNKRSLLAANPKQITSIEVIDELTIKISFWSTDKLKTSQVARSLRVLSMYLIDKNNSPNFSSMVLGSRLFKMTAYEDKENITDLSIADKKNMDEHLIQGYESDNKNYMEVKTLCRDIVNLLMSNSNSWNEEDKKKIEALKKIMEGENR